MASKSRYTTQDVINQSLVACGQGTQYMRVNSRACRLFVSKVSELDERHDVHDSWETAATQALERARTVGRVAAARAINDGRTYISPDDVAVALRRVMTKSTSKWCNDPDPPDDDSSGGTGGTYPPPP